MGRSPTAPDNGVTVNGPATPKSAEEELFCAEIQRRLLEGELRKPAGGDVRFASGILRGTQILSRR